jgi:hypothetical protein
VGQAGVNLRGLTGSAPGGRGVIYLSFDQPADAAKAARAIKKL